MSHILTEALTPAVDLVHFALDAVFFDSDCNVCFVQQQYCCCLQKKYPKTRIDVFVIVLEDSGSGQYIAETEAAYLILYYCYFLIALTMSRILLY